MSYISSNGNDLQKIKQHFKRYEPEYAILGLGVIMGLGLGAIFRSGKTPKIDKAGIIWEWMEEQVKNGYNIFALTNEQKALWESVWMFAEHEAGRPGWTLPMVVAQMTDDYIAAFGPSHPLSK